MLYGLVLLIPVCVLAFVVIFSTEMYKEWRKGRADRRGFDVLPAEKREEGK